MVILSLTREATASHRGDLRSLATEGIIPVSPVSHCERFSRSLFYRLRIPAIREIEERHRCPTPDFLPTNAGPSPVYNGPYAVARRRANESCSIVWNRSIAGNRRFMPGCASIGKEALARARELDSQLQAGHWFGPLHGIPMGVKDLFDWESWPTAARVFSLRKPNCRPRFRGGRNLASVRGRSDGEDGHDTVRELRSSRHEQSLERGTDAGGIVERFGSGSFCDRNVHRRDRFADGRLDYAARCILRYCGV